MSDPAIAAAPRSRDHSGELHSNSTRYLRDCMTCQFKLIGIATLQCCIHSIYQIEH